MHRVPKTFQRVVVMPPRVVRGAGQGPPIEGFVDFQGIPVEIENTCGSIRAGVAKDGTSWSVRMPAHYGEIDWRKGTDGDHVDAFVGDNADSPLVVVVHCNDLDGDFDEDKILLGYDTVDDALAAFRAAYDRPSRFYGGHTTTSIGHLRRWLLEVGAPPERFHKGIGSASLRPIAMFRGGR